jgi:sulfate transport system substrate-binding protein
MKKILLNFLSLALWAKPGISQTLLNVSYDPTRELYSDINKAFDTDWQKRGGEKVEIRQSHGGSGKQARAVIDGLQADVVTLGLAYDIDAIAQKSQAIPLDWNTKFPHHSVPFSSTIVFLVRKGNPKGIKDWGDLVKPGVSVITANPKTSGGARWAYLAAWAWAQKQPGANQASARDFIAKLYHNVPVLDSGARGASTTFVERGIGDVELCWENEAHLALEQNAPDKFLIIVPSLSILAETPVAVVEKFAAKHGTLKLANAYLNFLYSPQAQAIAAKHWYRPILQSAELKSAAQFPKIHLVTIDQAFGGWAKAQKLHFDEGGIFDQIYAP